MMPVQRSFWKMKNGGTVTFTSADQKDMEKLTSGISFYLEGRTAGQLAIDKGVEDTTKRVLFVREEYQSLLVAIGQKRKITTYREYLRGALAVWLHEKKAEGS